MSGRLGRWVLRRWPEALAAPRWPGQRWSRARGFLLIAVVVVALAPASVAVADTDPAGTYLLGNQVFLSSQPVAVSPAQRRLLAVVREANQVGFQIRVAIVPSQYDLGSVPALWRKPQTYARFLETELAPSYRGRLLVVMPNGLGFSWPGMVATPNYWPLRVPVGAGADGLAAAGDAAVSRLAAAAGLTLAPVPTSKGGPARASSADLLPIVGAGLGVLAALAALAIVLPRARWRLAASRERRRLAGRAGFPGRLRWALPGSAVCALAVATPLVVLHRGSSQVSESPAVKAPLLSWPAGRRAAPGFVLHDQNGKKVSLAAYRNRTVIVTFIDPLCRNLCPLEAQVLNQRPGGSAWPAQARERRLPT
jgi:hypothetical protein